MSIINEALKKAGQQPVGFRPELLKKKSRVNWGPIFIVAVLILITAPILAPLFHNPYKSGAAVYASRESAPKRQFAVEEAPLAPQSQPLQAGFRGVPNFSLTGLVYSSGGSFCLINGKVIKPGEAVGGATLVKVTPTEAVLNYRGESIVLPASA